MKTRHATAEEVDRLNTLVEENPMYELPFGIHCRLARKGFDTREKVIQAFERDELLPGKISNFGKKSYNVVAKWIGRAPFPGCGRNKAYVEGIERAIELISQGASADDLDREVKALKQSLETQRKLKRSR